LSREKSIFFRPGTPPFLPFFPFQNPLFFFYKFYKNPKSSAPAAKKKRILYKTVGMNRIKTHGGNLSNASAPSPQHHRPLQRAGKTAKTILARFNDAFEKIKAGSRSD